MKEMYQRCNRCIMDNKSDSTITFDPNGVCNYCTDALKMREKTYFPNQIGREHIKRIVHQIRKEGKGKKYDCIMGVSGGLDSSYLAYLGWKWKLRVLAIHIDDGYDTEISTKNLKRIIDATGFDYKVIKPDKEQFNQLTLAYLRAGVPNIAVPQDNILFAFLYKQMKLNGIKWFLSGNNFSLECILQHGNTYKNTDIINIRDINQKFGLYKIDKLEFISSFQRVIDRKVYGLKTIEPLNYVDYQRDKAFERLEQFCGFEYYGRKHLENILTAFAQLYWFPKKFGVDKRTSHLSSMIVSEQISREEALRELAEPLYSNKMMEEYISIIKDNMHIDDNEFEKIMNAKTHQHKEYKTEDDLLMYRIAKRLYEMSKKVKYKK